MEKMSLVAGALAFLAVVCIFAFVGYIPFAGGVSAFWWGIVPASGGAVGIVVMVIAALRSSENRHAGWPMDHDGSLEWFFGGYGLFLWPGFCYHVSRHIAYMDHPTLAWCVFHLRFVPSYALAAVVLAIVGGIFLVGEPSKPDPKLAT